MPIVYHRDRPFINSVSGHPSLSMVVNREVGSQQLSVWITDHAPGEVIPLHFHEFEEVLTFISGDATVTVGDETFEVHGDVSVIVPPRTPHGYTNIGTTPLRIVASLANPDAQRGKLWQPEAVAATA